MMKQRNGVSGVLRSLMEGGVAVLSGALLTGVFFLFLPLLQKMGRPPETSLEVRSVDTAVLQPPPPPPPEEEAEEEKPDEPPPMELTEQAPPPLDLSQLEMALDPGFADGVGGSGMLAGGRIGGAGDADRDQEADAVFSLADLDQQPRVVNQPPPQYPAGLRSQKARGTVYVLFVVDRNGRVVMPRVQKSTHSAFEKPALEAVRQWRFEPGKRSGQTVQFRMRVPITFACG